MKAETNKQKTPSLGYTDFTLASLTKNLNAGVSRTHDRLYPPSEIYSAV